MTNTTKTIILLHRGTNLAVKGDYIGALAIFDVTVQIKPDCAAVYFARGMCHAEQGNDIEALADYHVAIRLKPDFELAIRNRDALCKKMNKIPTPDTRSQRWGRILKAKIRWRSCRLWRAEN